MTSPGAPFPQMHLETINQAQILGDTVGYTPHTTVDESYDLLYCLGRKENKITIQKAQFLISLHEDMHQSYNVIKAESFMLCSIVLLSTRSRPSHSGFFPQFLFRFETLNIHFMSRKSDISQEPSDDLASKLINYFATSVEKGSVLR